MLTQTHRTKKYPRVIVLALVTALSFLVMTAPSASATATWGTLTFDKNPSSPSSSILRFEIWQSGDAGQSPRIVASRNMRAGSGNGSTDDCLGYKGWLPNGTYTMDMWANYAGTAIKGYAFRLPNKACSSGATLRDDLFIHTETGANNVQCADTTGDQACRWEYPTYNDYLSQGCIKLQPSDIKYMYDTIRTYLGTSGSGGRVPFSLKVIS